MRHDGRQSDQLRPVRIKRRFTKSAPGSVLIEAGSTRVLCMASVDFHGVTNGSGQFIEVQGPGEEAPFSEKQPTAMLKLARGGSRQLSDVQQQALRRQWPFR